MSAFNLKALTLLTLVAIAIGGSPTYAAFVTGNLLTDPGWDMPLTNPLNGYVPVFNGPILNTWGAESGAVVGPENGITPLAGNGMHRQNQVGGVVSQTLQLVDVSTYATNIDANNVTLDMSAWYNVQSVLVGASAQMTVRFRNAANTYIGPIVTASSASFGGLDGNVATWEPLVLSAVPVVPLTRRIHVEVSYSNASLTANNPGYVDRAFMQLTIVPEPATCGMLLIGCLGMALGRRRHAAA